MVFSSTPLDHGVDLNGGKASTQSGAQNWAPVRGSASPAVSIYADRAYLRAELAEDVALAGLQVLQASGLDAIQSAWPGSDEAGPSDGAPVSGPPLGEIVLFDCPVTDDAAIALLSRLEGRAAQFGAQLLVSTSLGSLDAVFGCLDRSGAGILVSPSRADRMIGLGGLLAEAGNRVRERSSDDRLALLRLTEQVGQIAQKLEHLSATPGTAAGRGGAFRFARGEAAGTDDPATGGLLRTGRPSLPDPRLIRRIIRQRQLRTRFFEGELFADPAWDMLLDLTAARVEHTRVSVTSLCIASGVPPTTALRWISQMTDADLLRRVDDETDRRRAFITLTDKAAEAMARYFAEVRPAGNTLL